MVSPDLNKGNSEPFQLLSVHFFVKMRGIGGKTSVLEFYLNIYLINFIVL